MCAFVCVCERERERERERKRTEKEVNLGIIVQFSSFTLSCPTLCDSSNI